MSQVPPISDRIISWNVPYETGVGGQLGYQHICRECGTRTSGPQDPRYTGHSGDCSVYEAIKEALGV